MSDSLPSYAGSTPDLAADLRSPGSTWPAPPPPKPTKACPMPGNHRFRLHDDQGLSPTRIHPAERSPEEAIEVMQPGVGLLPLKNGELLSKSNGLQSEFVTRNEEGAKVGDHREGKRKHRLILLEPHPLPKSNPLILLTNSILMTYTASQSIG